ncbi:DUF6098 family protein [Jiangella gansuensis]|uniref:DUF6098 family protein n=1 Tax=Jiangella gansuensis TaxID=281473 RepID=UPI00047EFA02|nr:DUF6098 family protein [Jiangella gansuensis]
MNDDPRDGDDLPMLDSLDDVLRTVDDRPGLFVRYSKGPSVDLRNGPSRDYEADVDLPGWSVTTVEPEPWWTRSTADWVARRLCKYDELDQEDRFPWLLTARVVGYGPDHEPLVTEMRPVARVGRNALAEARRRYEERFDVGRGSAG